MKVTRENDETPPDLPYSLNKDTLQASYNQSTHMILHNHKMRIIPIVIQEYVDIR